MCDHIIGFHYASYPQHGEQDLLVSQGSGLDVDLVFRFCPVCGEELTAVPRVGEVGLDDGGP